jgi:hypothetical protein
MEVNVFVSCLSVMQGVMAYEIGSCKSLTTPIGSRLAASLLWFATSQQWCVAVQGFPYAWSSFELYIIICWLFHA